MHKEGLQKEADGVKIAGLTVEELLNEPTQPLWPSGWTKKGLRIRKN